MYSFVDKIFDSLSFRIFVSIFVLALIIVISSKQLSVINNQLRENNNQLRENNIEITPSLSLYAVLSRYLIYSTSPCR